MLILILIICIKQSIFIAENKIEALLNKKTTNKLFCFRTMYVYYALIIYFPYNLLQFDDTKAT